MYIKPNSRSLEFINSSESHGILAVVCWRLYLKTIFVFSKFNQDPRISIKMSIFRNISKEFHLVTVITRTLDVEFLRILFRFYILYFRLKFKMMTALHNMDLWLKKHCFWAAHLSFSLSILTKKTEYNFVSIFCFILNLSGKIILRRSQ